LRRCSPRSSILNWQEEPNGMRARQQLGERTLRLLGEGCTLAVLRELTCGPARPVELERRLPRQVHSAVMRALANLSVLGAVTREHRGGVPHRTIYTLTAGGVALVEVPAAAARWERRHAPARPEQGRPGTWAVRLLADPHTRAIVLTLAERGLTLGELHAACPSPLGLSALRKRVSLLSRNGIVLRAPCAGTARYALYPGARRLAHAALLAGRWECRYRGADDAAPAAELAGALRVIVPAARICPARDGVCRLSLDGPAAQPGLLLAASRGRLCTLSAARAGTPDAEALATPYGWCAALLERAPDTITTRGDDAFARALVNAVAIALVGSDKR
jgi:DNA-binding HxlR family transcriptional regulator